MGQTLPFAGLLIVRSTVAALWKGADGLWNSAGRATSHWAFPAASMPTPSATPQPLDALRVHGWIDVDPSRGLISNPNHGGAPARSGSILAHWDPSSCAASVEAVERASGSACLLLHSVAVFSCDSRARARSELANQPRWARAAAELARDAPCLASLALENAPIDGFPLDLEAFGEVPAAQTGALAERAFLGLAARPAPRRSAPARI